MAKFVVYEKVAEAIYGVVDKNTLSDGGKTAVNLGSGLIAGFAAAIVSQPADTMLSKINKTKGLPGEGTMTRLFKIGQELGIRGSYSGIGARLFMVGTLTAGQFAIYGGTLFCTLFFNSTTVADLFTDIKRLIGATGGVEIAPK
jgi:solute carrier family 25 (mitochondrial phosphate transporter), member 3